MAIIGSSQISVDLALAAASRVIAARTFVPAAVPVTSRAGHRALSGALEQAAADGFVPPGPSGAKFLRPPSSSLEEFTEYSAQLITLFVVGLG